MGNNIAVVHENGAGELKLNIVRRPNARRCSQCGDPYHRRNVMEQWTVRAEGHRYGWEKDIAKTCTKCTSERESQKIINIAEVRYSEVVKQSSKNAK